MGANKYCTCNWEGSEDLHLPGCPQPVINSFERQLAERRTVTDQQCKWEYDEFDDAYETNCGKYWQFNDGGPNENYVRFCHYCGRKIALEEGDD